MKQSVPLRVGVPDNKQQKATNKGISKVQHLLISLSISALLSGCASSPSSPGDADRSIADTTAESSASEESSQAPQKRCRRDSSTGSRLGSKRICE